MCIRTRVQTQTSFPLPLEYPASEISEDRSHQSGIARRDRGFRLISSTLRWWSPPIPLILDRDQCTDTETGAKLHP